MESSHHQFLKPFLPADDHRFEFELYTIPASSAWFSWDNIHEIEKATLKEFFDGASFTRNPRVYKEYRDFIISKYREDPSRKLTFSEVRKSLVGDVNYLLKVFLFLENSGLINFDAARSPSSAIGGGDGDSVKDGEEEERWKVKVEDGPPHGVRVVAIPNSLKPVWLPASVSSNNVSHLVESDFKLPPLSSHSDVYQEFIELICGNCEEQCESGHYKYNKDTSSIICTKCSKNGSYGKNKSADDYKLVDHTPDNGNHTAIWTESETLLLLESVLKHGDDWDLVAQNVQTKSKLDCISKLIQLPFGHLMLGPTYDRCRKPDTNDITNNHKRVHETKDIESQHVEVENKSQDESQQNGDAVSEGPPTKRICIESVSLQTDNKDEQFVPEEITKEDIQICEIKNQMQQDKDLDDRCHQKSGRSKLLPNISNSLMQQIARVSAVVGPHVAASAAEAAVIALCDENEIPKEIFDTQIDESERMDKGNGSEMDLRDNELGKGVIPLPLRMRATCATALGAAAAHAKLLAVQEDTEVERLVSTVVNTQLKKLQYKMKLLNELEIMMKNESTQLVEMEESLLSQRMDVVEKAIDAGISRWKDRAVAKSQVEIIL